MARAIWKGHVSFGLVEIPVGLVSAEERHERLRLSLADRRDAAPVGYVRVNRSTGEEVPWEEVVKAYDTEEGERVLLSSEELESANIEATQVVEILHFVDADEVHPIWFDKPYFLVPTRKKANKAYVLLRRTLERTGKVGIAKVVVRTRQHMAILTTREKALVLVLLRWSHEVRDVSTLDLQDEEEIELRDAEVAMAERLVASMEQPWEPGRHRDTYHEDVMRRIEEKVAAGETQPAEPRARPRARPVEDRKLLDLMPLLEKSLKEKGGRKVAAGPRKKKAATRKRPAPGRKSGSG